jgi:hypothetical protein
MIVVCTFWWRKCIETARLTAARMCVLYSKTAVQQKPDDKWQLRARTHTHTHTHTQYSSLVVSERTVMTRQMVIKQSMNMFQQPAVLDSKLLPFALFPCLADFPRLLHVSSVWVTDSMASRSGWKRQWTWSRKLQGVLEIFRVCRIDSREVHTKLETAVMRYLNLCTAVVPGNRRIWCSPASQEFITTHAFVLPCLSVSLLRLRVQTHRNRPSQIRQVWLFGAECRLANGVSARHVRSCLALGRDGSCDILCLSGQRLSRKLTPQSRVLLEKLIVSKLVRVSAFYEIPRFVTAFARTHQLPLSSAAGNNTRECYIQEKIWN